MLCYIVCLVRRKLGNNCFGYAFTDLCIVIEYKSKNIEINMRKYLKLLFANMNYRDIIKDITEGKRHVMPVYSKNFKKYKR